MTLFRLDASILPATSTSAELADIVQEQWSATHSTAPIVRRNVATDPLPSHAWTDAVTGGFTPEADRTPAQREALSLARSLADELTAADAAIFAVPLYNFGVSQHFKTWVDLVIAGAGPTATPLRGTPTVLVTVRGGGYGPGTPRAGWDHATPYLQRILADVWQAELTVVERELTLAATNPEMEQLRGLADDLHTAARTAAVDGGRLLASAVAPAA